MTDPINRDEDLAELQRKADREKSEWPKADEAGGAGEAAPDNDAESSL